MNITVKIAPPDGEWQTAYELIKAIAADNPGGNLNFIVEDVFGVNKKIADTLIANCEFNRNAHCPNVNFKRGAES